MVRTGRPTTNPKPYKMSVRVSEEQKQLITNYCEQKKVTQSQAISNGIDKLREDIKK